jgi:hypothetical protein
MPYIEQSKRIEILHGNLPVTPGELNYAISDLLRCYYGNQARINYQILNDILGALEGAKLEFYRRVVVPYEDKKIKENGDIY